jgi:hypothetical protein
MWTFFQEYENVLAAMLIVEIFAFRNYRFLDTYSATWVQLRVKKAKIGKKLQ